MNILVINGSPKGKNSTTLHTALYLQALHPEHTWTVLHAGQRIKALEHSFAEAQSLLEQAELLLFCYPVYTFLAPAQLHRFVELVKAHGVQLQGKLASQITTSKHFYDMTAHGWLESNCRDLGLRVIRGLSADMNDLLTDRGREEARMYWQQLEFSAVHGNFQPEMPPCPPAPRAYEAHITPREKHSDRVVAIVTNASPEDRSLQAMIADFQAALGCRTRLCNVREFPFASGCIGCFSCAATGHCVFRDGFEDFLRRDIQGADAMVYAFSISDHFTHSSMKLYDDRQFCNGHRTVTRGKPTAYLISGNYRYEPNLQTVVEGRCEVGGLYLAGIATDEPGSVPVETVAANLELAMEQQLRRPANCLGVGGMKIFRDLIWVMQGLMKADHKFYKQNGIYDFPQKEHKTIWQMKAVGALMAIPSVQKKLKGKMTAYIVDPYRKVVEQAKRDRNS